MSARKWSDQRWAVVHSGRLELYPSRRAATSRANATAGKVFQLVEPSADRVVRAAVKTHRLWRIYIDGNGESDRKRWQAAARLEDQAIAEYLSKRKGRKP